jgi:flagellar motor switch protein FliN/FliY
MTASETDDTGHGGEAGAQDFDQSFPGLASAGFPEADKAEEFSGIMPSASEVGMSEPHVEVDNSAMIAGLPVMMKVVLGSAKMPVATLAKLAKGSVVKLDKMVGDPVDILVNGHLIARGEVVVLNEASSRFGVVLTQVGKLAPSGK